MHTIFPQTRIKLRPQLAVRVSLSDWFARWTRVPRYEDPKTPDRQNYYRDLTKRVCNQNVDLLIVVGKFLTLKQTVHQRISEFVETYKGIGDEL